MYLKTLLMIILIIDTSLFAQKPYLRTIYIESTIEEDINLKNQFKKKFS